MNWKIIILGFTISLFLFIFIMSGYNYHEGFNIKQMRAKQIQMKQMQAKQIQANQAKQMNQIKKATQAIQAKQLKQINDMKSNMNRIKQSNQMELKMKSMELNMSQAKQKANLSINKAVNENNNIISQLNRLGDLIYNTLNPNKPSRKPPMISSKPIRSNLRSQMRTPIKKGRIRGAGAKRGKSRR